MSSANEAPQCSQTTWLLWQSAEVQKADSAVPLIGRACLCQRRQFRGRWCFLGQQAPTEVCRKECSDLIRICALRGQITQPRLVEIKQCGCASTTSSVTSPELPQKRITYGGFQPDPLNGREWSVVPRVLPRSVLDLDATRTHVRKFVWGRA